MTPVEKLVAVALNQVGYLGKKSATQLDSLTDNAGGKYTKYARDLDALGNFYNGPKQGFDWCDIFVDWCFVQTFGRKLAQELTFQPDSSCGAGTGYSLNYYKNNGQLFSTPEVGDQIFFGDTKSTWHTGIVTRVDGSYISTVEGNSGNPLGVHAFNYPKTMSTIKGYGRPKWSLVNLQGPGELQLSKPTTEITTYATIEDVPSYYQSAIAKVMIKGVLQGTGSGIINVTEDMCRILTVLDRLGKLD